ncbi:hypothetical protein J1N35_025860 [Gossypium stocksii]|uniref:Uncharacterized protein n=1 Tax=Gossypium stocksii TaxID=47602 RepID=A0A9D3ZXK2_9ROSI|nr:hypothetical protein J1N35_025860 [Gossypium stocksii]
MIAKEVFDPININIEEEVVVDVEVELTTNLELKYILNESVDELIHFLAITKEVSTKKVDEFFTFSFEEKGNARVTKASRDMEGKKFEKIIPRKMICGWLGFGTKWLVI